SIRMTSGLYAWASRMASAPPAASPTTSRSSSVDSTADSPMRTISWSSTSSTLIGLVICAWPLPFSVQYRDADIDAGALAGRGNDLDGAAQFAHPFLHRFESVGCLLLHAEVEPDPVVAD